MAIVVQQPPEAHTAFNPVILRLKASSQDELDNGIHCLLISDGKTQELFSEFFNNRARFELSEVLKYRFTEDTVILPQSAHCHLDKKLSFDYAIKTQGITSAPDNVSNHTAVNSVVQIGHNPNMLEFESRFLTHFPVLKKYEDYPLEVSCLNNTDGIFVNFDEEKINQEAISNRHFSIKIPDDVSNITLSEGAIF